MEKIGVFCASSDSMEPRFYEAARQLGQWIGQTGRTLVYGGIKCGMMEVVAQAVHETGGKVFGVVPMNLKLKETQSECIDIAFYCDDLTDRKQWLVQESDVLVVLPGSFGTLDEAFTAMAANMVGMHDKLTIFYNVDGYYDTLFRFFDELTARGAASKPWTTFAAKADTLDELTSAIEHLHQ